MLINLSTIEEVKDYIFVELRGSGVYEDNEGWFELQLNDYELTNIIDNTLRIFIEHRYNGIEEGIYVLESIEGERVYEIPKNIYWIPFMYHISDPSLEQILNEDIRSHLFYSGYNNLYGHGAYENFRSYIYQLNTVISDSARLFRSNGKYRFNWYNHTITLLTTPKTSEEVFIFKTYYTDLLGTESDIGDYGEIFNDILVRRHLVASTKMKLGWNLKYVQGIQVPNFQIDANAIYQEGKEELEKIEEEFKGNDDVTLINFGHVPQ